MTRLKSFLLACAIASLPASALAADPAYRLVKTVSLGAPDRWDYLTFDAPSHRVYIAHGDRVTVVDGASGALIGNIEGMPGGTHGIAVSHATGHGYTDDGKAGEVAVFDPNTLKVTARIKAQPDADGIVLDPASGNVFVIDGDSAKVTVIDPHTDKVIATIEGGGGLEAAAAGNGHLYVDGAENKDVVVIDTKTNKVEAHWPMPDCTSPHGAALDAAHHRFFASCANAKMAVVNTDSGAVIAMLPIDKGTDGAGFDPKRNMALSSNGASASLSRIHEIAPDKFEALEAQKTALGARTMAIDEESGRVYVVAADYIDNPDYKPENPRSRYKVVPGSAKLFMYDPVK